MWHHANRQTGMLFFERRYADDLPLMKHCVIHIAFRRMTWRDSALSFCQLFRDSKLTFVRVKMMVTKTLGVTPLQLGINQTLPDHLLGHLFVIRPLLLLALAVHADGLMVID